MADQPGADPAGIVAHEDAEIGEGRIAKKRLVVFAQTVIDDLAVFPGWLVLEAEPKPRRQIHDAPRVARCPVGILYPAGKILVTWMIGMRSTDPPKVSCIRLAEIEAGDVWVATAPD